MSPSLSNLQDLRTALGRLNAERPAVEKDEDNRTRYQERECDFSKRVMLDIESRQGKARVLVTGQIGVGKSSELLRFHRIRKSGYWIFCDLEKEEHPEKCGPTGVFLTLLRDVWSVTRYVREKSLQGNLYRRFIHNRNQMLENLIDWLRGERQPDMDQVVLRFGGMNFTVYLNDKSKALAMILGKAAQHEAVSDVSERFGIVADNLVISLNNLIRWIRDYKRAAHIVLVVDHVDKIRLSSAAREVLLDSTPQWNRIDASIILTAPYEFTLGEYRHSLESFWNRPLMLHPLDIPDESINNVPLMYKRIVKTSGLEHLIEDESLGLLAHYSGGIPRLFVQFLIQSCKEAHLNGQDLIGLEAAQSVIQESQRSYQDYGQRELCLLDEIDQRKTGIGEAATLLRSPIGLLVMESRGSEQALRVHPLAMSALERHRMRNKLTASKL